MLALPLLAMPLRAEYQGFYLKLQLTLENDRQLEAYTYVVSAYLNEDSVHSSTYLLRMVAQQSGYESDSLTVFTHLLTYRYRSIWQTEGAWPETIYAMAEPLKLQKSDVQTVTLLDRVQASYILGVASPLRPADTLWTTTPVRSAHVFEGYFCLYQIFVHEDSPEIEAVLREIRAELRRWEADPESVTDEEKDAYLAEKVEVFYRFKVVVIAECTC